MRYTEIIIYRRGQTYDIEGNVTLEYVTPYRVTTACGHHSVKQVDMGQLFLGHCEWIGEQIHGSVPQALRQAA